MFYCRRLIRDNFIRSEWPGEAVQFQPLRPLIGEEWKGEINFLPPASTAQSHITSLDSSNPVFFFFYNCFTPSFLHCHHCFLTNCFVPSSSISCYSNSFSLPPAQTSATNILSITPSTSHSAMNHPSLVTPVQPFPTTSPVELKIHPLTDNSRQVASPISHGKQTSHYSNIQCIIHVT